MLVLTRRPNEEIVFPRTGIRVRILHLESNAVSVGIDAPPEIEVLRGELDAVPESAPAATPQPSSHTLRNRLNRVTLGIFRFQQQWQSGEIDAANATLRQTMDELATLDRDWPTIKPTAPTPAPARRCRTLVVEDDANERELLAGILGMNGCDCETAADGQLALDYLRDHDLPDFLLLDMGLPRLDGAQVLARIRKEPRCAGLKVFVISGTPQCDLPASAAADADAWFTKPLNPRRLCEAMQKSRLPQGGR